MPDRLADVTVNLPPETSLLVSEAERAIERLNLEDPGIASLEAVARMLLRGEAVASSRIEGLAVGPRRLLRAEAARQENASLIHGDRKAAEIVANIEAMRLGVEELAARERITLDDVLQMHRILMVESERPDLAGQLRQEQNWIGTSNYNPCHAEYVPPPETEVPWLIDDLIACLNTTNYPPLVHAALVHAQFETIHPFADGNGRIGRALVHVVLRRRQLAPRYVPPISLVLATVSKDYIAGLTAYRYLGLPDSLAAQTAMADWIAFFASSAYQAARSAQHFGGELDRLVERWRVQAGPLRRDSAAAQLIPTLPTAPVISVVTAARLTGKTVQAANQAVNRLVEAGVLRPVKAVRWGRVFEADGLVDALVGFERQLASPTGDTVTAAPVRPVPNWPNHPGARV